MTNSPQAPDSPYRPAGLRARLERALARLAPDGQTPAPRQLGALDQFHTRGLAATRELAELAGIAADHAVLDVGSGLGGPARYVAASCGCRVIGVDLSEEFVEAARYLSARTAQAAQVEFRCASALALPFDDASFDRVLLQHVAMNIAQRAELYREMRRVLAPGGRLAVHDVVRAGGEPLYPLPWARSPGHSFLLDATATRDAVEAAGFRTLAWRDDTPTAIDWAKRLPQAAGAPPAPGLAEVMGEDFPQRAANLARSLLQRRVGVLMAVFEAA